MFTTTTTSVLSTFNKKTALLECYETNCTTQCLLSLCACVHQCALPPCVYAHPQALCIPPCHGSMRLWVLLLPLCQHCLSNKGFQPNLCQLAASARALSSCRHQQSWAEVTGGECTAADLEQSWPAAAAVGCALLTPSVAPVKHCTCSCWAIVQGLGQGSLHSYDNCDTFV